MSTTFTDIIITERGFHAFEEPMEMWSPDLAVTILNKIEYLVYWKDELIDIGKKTFRQLMHANPPLDQVTKDNFLFLACQRGYEEGSDLLIRNGADIHAFNSNGETPLHVALSFIQIRMAKLLLEAGANANAVERRHCTLTPFDLALGIEGPRWVEVARMLFQYGAEVNNRRLFVRRIIAEDNVEFIPWLIDQADHDLIDDEEAVEKLIKYGFNVDTRDKNGLTLLHYAAAKNLVGIARVLLQAGADASALSPKGVSPFRVATCLDNNKIIALLIENGAIEL